MKALIGRLVADEGGQDLVEYVLLTTVISLVSIASLDLLVTAIGSVYGTWNTSTNSIWEVPNPSGS